MALVDSEGNKYLSIPNNNKIKATKSKTTKSKTTKSIPKTVYSDSSVKSIINQIKEFNPNIDRNALLELARQMLAPLKSEKETAYNKQLKEIEDMFASEIADVDASYQGVEQNLAEQRDDAKVRIDESANNKGMYWSTVPEIQKGKVEKEYAGKVSEITQDKQRQKDKITRAYNTDKSNTQNDLAMLASLIEQQATSMVPDLYNQEYQKQLGTWQANMEMLKLKQAVWEAEQQAALQREGLALQRASANRSAAPQSTNEGLSWKDKLSLDEAVSGYKGQLYTELQKYASGLSSNAKLSNSDRQKWDGAYNSLNSWLNTIPDYARGSVNDYFTNSDFYKQYQNYANAGAGTNETYWDKFDQLLGMVADGLF